LSWTFFFAHPDDELGIAGWMNHLVKSGCRVHACWAHSTPIRMQESLVAMNLIGLDDDDCRFGDLPDGGFLSDMLMFWKTPWLTGMSLRPLNRVT
jgi:LmbE family N-acetylglucosaminyl deacetylase